MKITIYKSLGRGVTTPILIDSQGEGTKESPVIIQPSSLIPKDFILRGYKYHIVLRGFKSRYILVERCQNLLVEDCELNRLRMERCSNIIIKNFTCLSRLTLYRCKSVLIERSFLARLRLFKSSRNKILNNFLIRFKEVNSKNNQLELNDIRKVQMGKSFNFLLSENSMCCAMVFGAYLLSIFLFLPILLIVKNSNLRVIIFVILLSMLGIVLVISVAVLIYLGIIRPILNRHNKSVIEREKIRAGIGYLLSKKEEDQELKIEQEIDLNEKLKEKSTKVKRAYRGFFEIDEEIIEEFGFKGEGTQSSPYVIDSTDNLPQEILVHNSKYFIKVINCNLTSHFLGLYECQNILVENCELNFCEVGYSSNIKFLNCNFNDGLRIGRSKNIKSEKCFISKIGLDECYSNSLIKCEIKELEIKASRGNIFQNCKLPIELLEEQNLNPPKKIDREIYFFIPIAIAFICGFVIVGFPDNYFFSFMTMGIIGIVTFIILFLISFFSRRRLKKEKFNRKFIYSFPPNKVI
jgi:hypothetical protein